MKIFIDADACPVAVKEILYKTSSRLQLTLILVANQNMRVPQTKLISLIIVEDGADAADDKIVELMEEKDLIITDDIPLASRVIEKNGVVMNYRGLFLNNENIGQRLAVRNLMDDLRTGGMQTGGPNLFGKKEKQNFANQLDRYLTAALK